MVASSWDRSGSCFRQTPVRLSRPFQEPHCLPQNEEGPRKGGLNIAHSTLSWIGNRTYRDIPSSGRNTRRKQQIPIRIATWNSRTLIDTNQRTDRPQRRTAFIAAELKRYKVDIAALSETRFLEEGSLN